jgi:hypothetical protein
VISRIFSSLGDVSAEMMYLPNCRIWKIKEEGNHMIGELAWLVPEKQLSAIRGTERREWMMISRSRGLHRSA